MESESNNNEQVVYDDDDDEILEDDPELIQMLIEEEREALVEQVRSITIIVEWIMYIQLKFTYRPTLSFTPLS